MEGAVLHAEKVGAPMNLAITINLDDLREAGSQTALARKAPNEALRQFRGDVRRFCRKQKVPHASVWVREVSARAGEHLHMAMHLPDDALPALLAFLTAYTGAVSSAEGVSCKADVLGRSQDTSWLVKRVFQPEGWLRYMTKGVDGFQGVTFGKRSGCSRNIGKAAQMACDMP